MTQTLTLLFLILFSVHACGKKETTKTDDCAVIFDTDIKPIVASGGKGNCGGCHAGSYDNKDTLITKKSTILAKLQSTDVTIVMPRATSDAATGDLNFQSTDEGKKFIQWASCTTPK